MKILGIAAYYHDSSAALVIDGKIIAAAQEERFTRKKHDEYFPTHAINYCLKQAKCSLGDIDYFVFYDKPFLKFERLIETYVNNSPRGFTQFFKSIPIWLKEKLFQKRLIISELEKIDSVPNLEKKLLFSEHHLSHAASAYYPSPFENALVLTLDGVGEWATASVAIGSGSDLKIQREMHFPNSLGLLYSAITYHLGFKVNSGEYKVMGLAPYGEPKFTKKIIENLIDLKPDGSFQINMKYFDYAVGLRMTNRKFDELFALKRREPEERLEQIHMDMAASIQSVTEEIMLRMTRSLAEEYKIENLCLAGGVALNCVANGKILRDQKFKNIWIQPAAGDAGGALGAALYAYYSYLGNTRKVFGSADSMSGSYLGPEFSSEEIRSELDKAGAVYEELNEENLLQKCVQDLKSGKALGWMQGRMEFGPRALGARSILADPRNPEMQKTLNLRVKFRESFRPFAPSVLSEKVQDWFEINVDSPYMLLVANVQKHKTKPMSDSEKKLFGIEKLNTIRSEIPSVTHVDYSARIQTVHRDTNPIYHKLLSLFEQSTGCPVLVNTSFNVRGEPIVCTPTDAFRCFMGTDIEALSIGNFYLQKENQKPELIKDYRNQFELD